MIDFNSQLAIIPKVYETAQLQDDLEHSGGVTISWKSAESTEIPLGSYITYKGMRYILLEPYAPTKSGIHYQYSTMFKHPQNMLDRVPFWITSRDAGGNIIHLSTTSFTGTPFIIIKKICDFMAEYANEMQDDFFAETVGLELTDPTQPWNASTNPWKATWTFDDTKITDTSKTIITVGFDGSSLKSAADAIASAMGCNLYWDWSAKKLMFISGTTITGDSYNCFHVLGGTTNMGKNTVSGGYAAVTQRLTLNTAQYPGSIIDCRPVDEHGKHYGIRLTKDLILDDIYPKMELYIKTARERLCILTDNETGDFIVDHFEDKYYYMSGGERVYTQKDHTTGGKDYDADGHELTKESMPIYKTFAKWYVTFEYADGTPYVFDQRLLIKDQPLGILFQLDLQDTTKMSSLVGNQFNATYFPAADDEWDKNDAKDDRTLRPSDEPWHINAGEYYINFEAEGEIILPTTSKIVGGIETGLVPEVGKKVTLVNVALTTEEATAKEELLDAATEIIGLMNTPAGEYSEPVIFAEPISGVQPPHTIEPKMVGDDSPFGNTHGPVVTNVDLNIDTNEATVTVGSWSRKTKTGGTADKVETVSVSAASATNGSDPYSTGDLGEGHYVPKTSSSSQTTIAQTQVKPSGAFVVSLTPDNQTIDCNASGIVKTTKNIYIQIAAYYGSRDVTAGCRVAYTQALPQSVKIYLQASGSGESGTEMVINRDYDLTNGLDWLRINIPQGTNFSALSGVLARTLDFTHSAYGSRNAAITISGIYDGTAGVAGAFKSTVFKRTNTTPVSAPTGGDYDHPVPSGWEDGIPNGEEMLWASVCTFKADGTSSGWSTPKQMTDTADFDVEFSVVETNPGDPTNNPANWSNRASASTIWMATREKHNGVWSGWQIAKIKGEAGTAGVAGAFKSRVFVRTNTDLSTAVVAGGTYDRPYPTETTIGGQTVSVSWQDSIPQGDAKLWSTVRTFHADNRTTPWSSPSQETDTQTQDIEFAFAQSGDAQPAEPNDANRHGGSGTQIWFDPVLDAEGVPGSGLPSGRHWNEMVWRAEREIKNGSPVGGWVITRIKGEAGNRGGNTATVPLYKRSSSAVNTVGITITLYYKFKKDANGKNLFTNEECTTPFTGQTIGGNGWSPTIPLGTDPIYITNAIAFNTAESDEIGTTEWVTPVKYTENGVNGSNGINAAAVFLYQRSASTPTGNTLRPSDDLYYKFADGKLYTDGTLSTEVQDGAAVLRGWQRAFPASNGQPCWVIQAAALSADAYDEIEYTEWSTPVQMVKDGTDASNDDNTIMGLLGELASTINPRGFLRDSSYTLIISETQPANGSQKIWYKPSSDSLKAYYNYSWQSIGSNNVNAIRILGEIVGFVGNEHTFKVTNSDNSTTNPAPPSGANKYDIYTKSSKFTDKFTNQSITGGLGVWVFDGEVWQMVKDNVQGLLENYGDHIVNAVFGTDPSGFVNYASWMMTAKNFAEMVASATGLDDDKALASVRAICQLDADGKPTGTVRIDADLINFFGKKITFKKNSESNGPSMEIGFGSVTVYPYKRPPQTLSTVYMTLGIGSTSYAKLAIIPNISGNPYVSFAIEGDVIADSFITRYLNTSTGGMEEIAGASGSFYDGEGNEIAVKNGIIVGELPHD